MIKVLVDAELMLGLFLNNEYAASAELLLANAKRWDTNLFVTNICLDKLKLEDEIRVKNTYREDLDFKLIFINWGVTTLNYKDCYISQEAFARITNTRHFEIAVEISYVESECIDAIITHKPEDWTGSKLPVWTVNELQTICELNRCLHLDIIEDHHVTLRNDKPLEQQMRDVDVDYSLWMEFSRLCVEYLFLAEATARLQDRDSKEAIDEAKSEATAFAHFIRTLLAPPPSLSINLSISLIEVYLTTQKEKKINVSHKSEEIHTFDMMHKAYS